jgi:hypothetical protein
MAIYILCIAVMSTTKLLSDILVLLMFCGESLGWTQGRDYHAPKPYMSRKRGSKPRTGKDLKKHLSFLSFIYSHCILSVAVMSTIKLLGDIFVLLMFCCGIIISARV